MNIWISLIWVIASLMACWSFSIFVRWVSEAIARRRKRLVSARTNRSFWLAPILMLVCAAASILAGYMASTIENRYGFHFSSPSSPIGLCGGALGIFGLCMLIWACIGDRARGRIRCPQCWYDLSDSEGLKCSECGHTAKNQGQLSRARRPRWAFKIAPLFLLVGVYGVVMNKRVADDGYLAMMPNWVMLAGWESFPESWATTDEASLTNRIHDRIISRDAYLKLGEDIVDQMLESKEHRWDPTRHLILRKVFNTHNRWRNSKPIFPEIWIPSEHKLDRLLVLLGSDILDALLSENPSAEDLHILDLAADIYAFDNDPYYLGKEWMLSDEDRSYYFRFYPGLHPFIYPIELNSFLENALSELRTRAEEIDLIEILESDDRQKRCRAIPLLIDTGAMSSYIDHLLELGLSVRVDDLGSIPLCHAFAISQSSDERASAEYLKLGELIEHGDVNERAYVLALIYPLSFTETTGNELVIKSQRILIEKIRDVALLDTRFPTTSEADMRIDQLALQAILRFDASGEIAFPILRAKLLKDGPSALTEDLYKQIHFNLSDERIANWALNFEQLVDAEDPRVRLWVIENLPEQTGTPSDEQLDGMVNRMLGDSDEDVADKAITMQGKRYSNLHRPQPD